MVVGTLNSTIAVGTLKSNIKCYMGARQGSETGSKTGTLPLTPLATSWWWGTLNSSMVAGTLKSSIKMLYVGMGQGNETGSKTYQNLRSPPPC